MSLRDKRKKKKNPVTIEELEGGLAEVEDEEVEDEDAGGKVEEALESRLENKLADTRADIDTKSKTFDKFTADMQKDWNKKKVLHDKEINVLETKAIEIQGALKLVRGDL